MTSYYHAVLDGEDWLATAKTVASLMDTQEWPTAVVSPLPTGMHLSWDGIGVVIAIEATGGCTSVICYSEHRPTAYLPYHTCRDATEAAAGLLEWLRPAKALITRLTDRGNDDNFCM